MHSSVTPRMLIALSAGLLLAACGAASPEAPRATGPLPSATALRFNATLPAAAQATAAGEPTASNTPLPTAPPRPTPPPGGTAGDTWQSPLDDMTLVFVPAGDFIMGAAADFAPAEPDERPQHEVILADYWLDSTEVTFAMYRLCSQDGACGPPIGPTPLETADDHPAAGVSWHQAADYCRWAGRRLPSEAEWEKASRGQDGRRYAWGWIGAPESRRELRLNFCDSNCPFDYRDESFDDGFARSAPVGSYPAGASPYGALDLAGNVWEWTSDWYQGDYYSRAPVQDPTGPRQGVARSIRGGSWAETTWEGLVLTSRASNRFWHQPERSRPDLGFRCAVGSEP